MPRINHLVECDYQETFRSAAVAGMFDVPVVKKLSKHWKLSVPLEEKPWSIGLITGASGAGKTVIAKELFGDNFHEGFTWNKPCLLDDFSERLSVTKITETLSKVGFSSPPQWLLPYAALSNGQKFRVELARCLLEYEGLCVFDEFTSVVDRTVAQIGAFAFQKAVRRAGRQFVAVTCHYDVEEWLQPDWVLDVSTGEFKWGCLRRPELEFEIMRVESKAWRLFKDHHYLTATLNPSAVCYGGFIRGQLVAFDAWLPFVGRLRGNRKGKRGHRTVVLPDYQGLGLGNRLFTTVAQQWAALGYEVFSNTAHPAEVSKRVSSGQWRLIRKGRTVSDGGKMKNMRRATNRLTCSFKFIGEPMELKEARKLYGK